MVTKRTYGIINNVWGWIKSTDVKQTPKVNAKFAVNTKATKPSTASTQTVSKVAQVNANNSGARATVYDKTGKNATKYANRTFNVSKEKQLMVILCVTSKYYDKYAFRLVQCQRLESSKL